jgi:maltose O-acetyltransferase
MMFNKMIHFARARIRKALLEEIWLEDYIKMGMQVGKNCSIQPGVVIDYSHCWLIKIGDNVTIAPQAYLLAHDASTKRINNYTKIGSVTIEDNVFIGAGAIINFTLKGKLSLSERLKMYEELRNEIGFVE